MATGTVENPARQKFDFGFEVIMWDLGGHSVDDALDLLAGDGYRVVRGPARRLARR